jgi:dTDP-4-dehydrorhamnose reductase
VRTAWLYGAHGPNFVRTMIRLERERPAVEVVDDQRGQPTWTADVTRQVIALIRSRAAPGIYHATSAGDTTWFGLAREIFRPAPRPAYSVLGHDAWARSGIEPIPGWRCALRRAFPVLAA